MRPHVEIVCEKDLVWHDTSLGSDADDAAAGNVLERRLSTDEETGAQTRKVRFVGAWERPAGYHQSDTELYVLAGALTAGADVLDAGGYLRAPAGRPVPAMSAAPGTEVLIFSDHGAASFTVSDRPWPGYVRRSRTDMSGLPGQLTIGRAADLDWADTPWEAAGSEPRSRVKVLYREAPLTAGTGPEPVTALWEAPPGWSDDAAHHRGSFAEAFGLAGTIEYSYGELTAGGYVFRPPRIQTARATVPGPDPALLLVRLGDTAAPWRTADPYVQVSGRAVNYDATNPREALIPSGFSVTSRSAAAMAARQRAIAPAGPATPAPSGVAVSRISAAPGR